MDDFWSVLWERGSLTQEDLASMDHPLTGTPFHLPHIIPAMEHYLWILKTTHSGGAGRAAGRGRPGTAAYHGARKGTWVILRREWPFESKALWKGLVPVERRARTLANSRLIPLSTSPRLAHPQARTWTCA